MHFRKFSQSTLFAITILTSFKSYSCAGEARRISSKQLEKFLFRSTRSPATSEIPEFSAGANQVSLESRLGNKYLEVFKKYPDAKNIIISLPALIEKSQFFPFPDGQSNARLSLGKNWKHAGFPLVAIQIEDAQGQLKRSYEFHESLKVENFEEVKAKNLGEYYVKPKGWEHAFRVDFNSSVLGVEKFLEGIPASLRTFSGNRIAPDPASVGVGDTLANLKTKNLGLGYNSQAWFADNVHGIYPSTPLQKTAVGGVMSWGIVDKKFGPFKQVYTCFETRNLEAEKSLGVPSGAGWHHIGDAAESVFNNLEEQSFPVAIARSHSGEVLAYGLSDSIVMSRLNPGEVLVSIQGEFHWYLNPHQSPICTEIWVHNCVPNLNNNWGMKCQ